MEVLVSVSFPAVWDPARGRLSRQVVWFVVGKSAELLPGYPQGTELEETLEEAEKSVWIRLSKPGTGSLRQPDSRIYVNSQREEVSKQRFQVAAHHSVWLQLRQSLQDIHRCLCCPI